MNLEKITTIFSEEQIITALLNSANAEQIVELMEDEKIAVQYIGIVIELAVKPYITRMSPEERLQALERIARETTSNAVLDAMVEEFLKRTELGWQRCFCKIFGEILTNKRSSIKTIMKALDSCNQFRSDDVSRYFFKNYTMDTEKLIEVKKFAELIDYSFYPNSIGHGCCKVLTKGRYSSQLIEYAFENFHFADITEQTDLIRKCKNCYLERVMQILAERYDLYEFEWMLEAYEKRTGKKYM